MKEMVSKIKGYLIWENHNKWFIRMVCSLKRESKRLKHHWKLKKQTIICLFLNKSIRKRNQMAVQGTPPTLTACPVCHATKVQRVDNTTTQCGVCGRRFCSQCHFTVHPGLTCEAFHPLATMRPVLKRLFAAAFQFFKDSRVIFYITVSCDTTDSKSGERTEAGSVYPEK